MTPAAALPRKSHVVLSVGPPRKKRETSEPNDPEASKPQTSKTAAATRRTIPESFIIMSFFPLGFTRE